MPRSDFELELVGHQFPQYTAAVRSCIDRVVNTERCDAKSDAVVEGLWSDCSREIAALLSENGLSIPRTDRSSTALGPEARGIVRTYIDQALSYEAKLSDLDDDNFDALYHATFDPITRLERAERVRRAQNKDRFEFFNKPNANADFDRWRSRLLSPAQAVALSLGKDPDVVAPKALTPYRRIHGSPFREAFKDRLDLIEAAVAAGTLTVPMSVEALVEWAAAQNMTVPSELMALSASNLSNDAAYWKQKYDEAVKDLKMLIQDVGDMHPMARASVYKMILAMAIDKYGHTTTGDTKATTRIKGAVNIIGLKIDDQPILDHLRAAARLQRDDLDDY